MNEPVYVAKQWEEFWLEVKSLRSLVIAGYPNNEYQFNFKFTLRNYNPSVSLIKEGQLFIYWKQPLIVNKYNYKYKVGLKSHQLRNCSNSTLNNLVFHKLVSFSLTEIGLVYHFIDVILLMLITRLHFSLARVYDNSDTHC